MSQISDDVLNAAENPAPQTSEFFGQAMVDLYFCVLQKGVGKVPFDPQQHRLEDRRTAVKVDVMPLAEYNLTRPIAREYVAEFGAWPKITLPSIKAIGLTLRQLPDAWVRIALVPEGRKYTDKNGEERESLTIKFLASYPDEAACRAAYLNQALDEPSGAAPTQAAQQPTLNNSNGNGSKERETALVFIDVLIKQVNGDENLLAQRIANMPQLAKHFTVQSPEVRAKLDAYAFEQSKQAVPA